MNEQYRISWENELAKCIKCGTCRSVCPILKTVDDESGAARGKLKIIEHLINGNIKLTNELEEIMNKCVLCKACTTSCPSRVNTYKVFLEIRQHLTEEKGLPLAKKAVFQVLKHRKTFDQSLQLGAHFQNFVFKDAEQGSGKVARIPLPIAGFNKRRIIPSLAKHPFRTTVPEVIKVEAPKYKVAFFTGCMFNYVYPNLGRDLVEVLLANDVEVIVPKEQQCCATPLFTSGETDIAEVLIRRNLEIFNQLNIDAIITGCGSCGLAWKTEFQSILDPNDPYYEIAGKLATIAYDISEFLLHIGINPEDLAPINKTVTYHDSCHLNRGQKVKEQPRKLISIIPEVQLIEMKEADVCCGSGGSFNLMYYDISRQINQKKNNNIKQTGADIVLTGCPACIMHITDGLGQDGIDVEVKHTIELLSESYRLKKGGN